MQTAQWGDQSWQQLFTAQDQLEQGNAATAATLLWPLLSQLGVCSASRAAAGTGAADEPLLCAVAEVTYLVALQLEAAGRPRDSDPLLRALGIRFKLSPTLYLRSADADSTRARAQQVDDPAAVQAFEGVLPGELLHAMRHALRPASAFWAAHNYYSPTSSFFSYMYTLSESPANVIEATIALMADALRRTCPRVAGALAHARAAEWWAHTRGGGAGAAHQLHFDLDERSLRRGLAAYARQHPLLSSVLYLSGPMSGGPTVVLEQRAPDLHLARRAWAVAPAGNRMAVWPGDLLHGVLPGGWQVGQAAASGEPRVTLVVAWWGGDRLHDAERGAAASGVEGGVQQGGDPRPGMAPPWRPAPDAGPEQLPDWAREFNLEPDTAAACERHTPARAGIQPATVAPAWVAVGSDSDAVPVGPTASLQHVQLPPLRFFVRHEREIRDLYVLEHQDS